MMQTDVFISGGGVAGLTAAAAFGAAGFSVVLADPMPPITDAKTDGADLRTTAFLQPARAFLDRANIWDRLAAHAAPLQIMRIVDAGGADPAPRVTRDFDAADISNEPFGWNLPNWLLRREIMARIAELPNVTLLLGTGFKSMFTRTAQARVTLTDGSRMTAPMGVTAPYAKVQASQHKRRAMGKRPSHSPSPTTPPTITFRQKFTAAAAPSPLFHCLITTESPVRRLCGWKTDQKQIALRNSTTPNSTSPQQPAAQT